MKALFATVKLRHVALVLVVVAVGLPVVAIALADSDETASSALQVNSDPFASYDTDLSFRKLWVRGCVGGSGESAAFCRCAITEYITRLQPWEFETLHAVARSPGGQLAELPDHLREVVKDVEQGCR